MAERKLPIPELRVHLFLCLMVVPLVASCANSVQVEAPRGCQQELGEINKLTLDAMALRAERAFLRKLPELMHSSSGKSALINSARDRKFGGSSLKVDETKEGFRWGWLLIELDSRAKSVRSIRVDPAGFGNAFSDMTNCFGEVSNLGTSLDPEILKD